MSDKTEYRMVVARPAVQEGRPWFQYPKRTLAQAKKALVDHEAHAARMWEQQGIRVWDAWIESREVTEWSRVEVVAEVDVSK